MEYYPILDSIRSCGRSGESRRAAAAAASPVLAARRKPFGKEAEHALRRVQPRLEYSGHSGLFEAGLTTPRVERRADGRIDGEPSAAHQNVRFAQRGHGVKSTPNGRRRLIEIGSKDARRRDAAVTAGTLCVSSNTRVEKRKRVARRRIARVRFFDAARARRSHPTQMAARPSFEHYRQDRVAVCDRSGSLFVAASNSFRRADLLRRRVRRSKTDAC